MTIRMRKKALALLAVLVVVLILAGTYQPHAQLHITPLSRGVSGWHDKWFVLTSHTFPIDDVKRLIAVPGWKVVVVVEDNTPAGNYSHPDVVVLDQASQGKLGLRTYKLLSFRSGYVRKTLGYLYAIYRGASLIFDIDEHIRPGKSMQDFIKGAEEGLLFAGRDLFHPYHHFGQGSVWPRGFPLDALGNPRCHDYLLGAWGQPLIQQGLVDADPDVDAYFRLTRWEREGKADVTFDPAAPPALLPPGVFAPFNSKNTLFRFEALWAMLLPVTITSRMSDIWRGYWAQRLLWEIQGMLSFHTATAHRVPPSTAVSPLTTEESQLLSRTSDLLRFLRTWTCQASLTFFQCMLQLTSDKAQASFLQAKDVHLARAWVEDLRDLGYREPERSPFKQNRPTAADLFDKTGPLYSAPLNLSQHVTRVQFHARPQQPPLAHMGQDASFSAVERMQLYQSVFFMCPNQSVQLWAENAHHLSHGPMDDVLLVVEFNMPDFYLLISHLETLHRAYFPNILYCGENWGNFKTAMRNISAKVSFVEVNVTKGFFGYECLAHATRIYYDVQGFFFLSEDVLLNTWNLKFFPRDKIWCDPKELKIESKTRKNKWGIWGTPWGSSALQKAQAELATRAANDSNVRRILNTMRSNHLALIKDPTGIPFGNSDIFYVPRRLREDFLLLAEIYRRHDVYLEIAVPQILYGLELPSKNASLSGRYLAKDRPTFYKRYKDSDSFLHPVKIGVALKTPTHLKFLCEEFFPRLLRHLT